MYNCRKLSPELYWVGASDRRLALFENLFPIPRGVSYNAYLLLDEKTVLLDTVDHAVSRVFLENLDHLLAGRSLDYLVVNHMEPDHCATLDAILRRWPEAKILCTAKAAQMIGQFFGPELAAKAEAVAEGGTLSTGRHTLRFVTAPMVHWPEVMVTFDETDGTLFSADAFGSFGALNGNLFADEIDFARDFLPDARRYYANIVGKYGVQVTALLNKASGLAIKQICPLHGPIWREEAGIAWLLEKYRLWSQWQPEEQAVMIAYGSMYGNTAEAAELLASRLAEAGVRNIRMYDVSVTDLSELVGEAFRCSHLVLASPTYNAGLYPRMEELLAHLKASGLQKRTVALLENGSWAPTAAKAMRAALEGMKEMTLLEPVVSVKSSTQAAQLETLDALAGALAASLSA